MGVAGRVNDCGPFWLLPKGLNVVVCPGAIGGNLVSELAAHGVGEHEDTVVDPLDKSEQRVTCHLIIKLVGVDLAEHV